MIADQAGSWHKASHSLSNGNCAEVGGWRKASHSMSAGDCVEVGAGVLVRDTKQAGEGPVLGPFSSAAWADFLRRVQAG